ncbi:MAG TPA: methyltransferase domain-containing protein [Pyrinomonadaceae bacterium]|jgi:ubiquinone/menaquinone biosynthesis C-methylase UbiE
MLRKFRQRSYELENIDCGNYTAAEYEECIVELQLVNEWLGDARTLKRTLLHDVEESRVRRFSVLDVGAGSGELLRVAASWARENNLDFSGVGLELNERSAKAIVEESTEFPNIRSVRSDARYLPFSDGEFDYVMCSLFTHHFVELEIINILREMSRVARRRIFVIDLHRHPIAYYFYTTIGKLFLHNRLLREDGALSILRSFKRAELRELAIQAGLRDARVSRHFPYRLVLSAAAAVPKTKQQKPSVAERAA